MQPTTTQPNSNEVVTQNGEWLYSLPSELLNIIPESLWVTLSIDQKKEVLRQNGLLEKYSNAVQAPQEQAVVSDPLPETSPTVSVEQVQKQEVSPEFAQAVESFKKEKEETKEETVVLTKEELDRIEAEKATGANTGTSSYNFFGYQPSQNIYTNASKISNDGDVADAKTWAATLIAKIFGLFER